MPKASARLATSVPMRPGTKHAKRLAGKLRALEQFAVPLAGGHRRTGRGNLPRQRAEHEEGQFRRGDGVAAGRVHHDDAPGRGGVHIDVIDAHAGAANDFQLRGGLEDFLGHLRFRTDDNGVRVRDERQEFGLGETLVEDGHFEFRALLEQGNSLGRNRIANQYVHKTGCGV